VSETDVTIEFGDVQHGWASANVRAGDDAHRMGGFSYTTDAFSDLATFAVDVALDAYKVEARFDGEPEGWVWKFETTWEPATGARNHFRIYNVHDFYDPDSDSVEALCVQVDRAQLARAILEAFEKLTSDMSVDGFEQAWLQPFPVRGIAALRTALETPARPQPDLGEPVMVVRIVGKPNE
jgi:hypothetical protein